MRDTIVIGGGAGGLGAAYELQRAGTDVMLVEGSASVGGKCLSTHVEGRAFDLGAIILNRGYRRTRRLASELGCELEDMPGVSVVDPDTGEWWAVGERLPGSRAEVASALARYLAARTAYFGRYGPGLAGANESVAQTFVEWLRSRDLLVLEDIIAPYFTSFGYGYLDEIPAIYPLVFFDSSKLRMLAEFALGIRPPRWRFVDGFQSLFQALAGRLDDVRVDCPVESVQREQDFVSVKFGSLEERAKSVVISTSPIDSIALLDSDTAERRVLESFQYHDYLVCVADVEGITPRSVFFEPNLRSRRRGHLMVSTRPWGDLKATILYAMVAPGEDETSTIQRIGEDLKTVGGSLGLIHTTKRWGRYFPHLPASALSEGVARAFEDLQGHRRTFWVGEALAFGAVEQILSHSQKVTGQATRQFR